MILCRNAAGEEASIIAIIKTQGSDTKLVAQMQPYYEAKGLSRWELAGKQVPPLVTQIADGENGLLVESVDAAAKAIVRLLTDQPLRRQLGARARQSVRERFLLSHLLEDWIDALVDARSA